ARGIALSVMALGPSGNSKRRWSSATTWSGCQVALWRALIHSRCSLWEKGEANLLKLLGVQTFSVASSMTLNSAAPPDWILTRSPPVRACRGRDLAPRLKQSPFRRNLFGDDE